MPNLVGPDTPDTQSINGPCLFPAKPVENPFESPNIYINKQKVKFLHSAIPPDSVEGQAWQPLVPCTSPLTPAARKVVTSTNTNVYFNKFLPAVQGDATELTSVPGTKRVFVAPFQHPTIIIASKAK